MNRGLIGEIVRMAFETLRTNKMRSSLTILGVVIGITSIVGMTSLIRGFDESLRDSIRALGPNTIFLSKISIASVTSGADFNTLMRRPNLTVADGKAIEKLAPAVQYVDIWFGQGGDAQPERVYYRSERTSQLTVLGATEAFADVNFVAVEYGRFFTSAEVTHRRRVIVLGHSPYEALFQKNGTDPVGKKVRVGAAEYTVVGVLAKRPSAIGDQDDFVVIPQTTYQALFSGPQVRQRGFATGSATIVVVPYKTATHEEALQQVEEIMRIRHGLKLDEPDDFDVGTQDALLKVWDRISNGIFLALVVISSIALMVGGIGVMAIMMISVTERTREIGVRKALGARRHEILFQFLMEAATLTLLGGVIGIIIGSGIGIVIHFASGFPISLPWWSFAIGLGFSASVGIFFGMLPAYRAAGLDPIEALRHE